MRDDESLTTIRSLYLDDTVFEHAMDGPLGSVVRSDMEDQRYEDIIVDVKLNGVRINGNERTSFIDASCSRSVDTSDHLSTSGNTVFSSKTRMDSVVDGVRRTKRNMLWRGHKLCPGCYCPRPLSVTWSRACRFVLFISVFLIGLLTVLYLHHSKKIELADSTEEEPDEVSTGGLSILVGQEDSSPGAKVAVPNPSSNLVDLCSVNHLSSSSAARAACEEACAPGHCCSLPSHSLDSCFLWNELPCKKYHPCSVLHISGPSSVPVGGYINPGRESLLPPPSNLPKICSQSNLVSMNAVIDCSSACQHGECCGYFQSGDEWDCSESHPDICDDYKPCQALVSFLGTSLGNESKVMNDSVRTPTAEPSTLTSSSFLTPQPTTDMLFFSNGTLDKESLLVELACTPEKVNSTSEEKELCSQVCSSRSCCFDASPMNNCRTENKDWCQKFSACEILTERPQINEEELGNSLPLKNFCEDSAFVTHAHMDICQKACQEMACCFAGGDSCRGKPDIDCNDFLFCATILNGVGYSDVGDGGNFSFFSYLETTCDENTLLNDEGKGSLCENVCRHGLCCIGLDGDCSDDTIFCEGFHPCNSAWESIKNNNNVSSNTTNLGDGGQLVPPSDFKDSCNAVAVRLDPNSLARCKVICEEASCCQEGGGSCGSALDICETFAECKNIWNNAVQETSQTYDEEEPQQNNNLGELNQSDPEIACAPSNLISEEGKLECSSVCSSWSCCFASGKQNCFGKNSEICRKYKVCPQEP